MVIEIVMAIFRVKGRDRVRVDSECLTRVCRGRGWEERGEEGKERGRCGGGRVFVVMQVGTALCDEV